MGLATLIDRLLGRPAPDASKNAAKDRLRLVLMHDRSDIPATMMEAIRTELVQALSKYVEIDNEALEVQLEREAGSIGLSLNIPIRRVKTEAEAAEALAAMHALQRARDGAAPEEPEAGSDEPETGNNEDAEPIVTTSVEEDEGPAATRDGRDTGELAAAGTGDLAAEKSEPND